MVEIDERLNNFINNVPHKKLTNEKAAICEEDINLNEMGEALKQLNNNSAGGNDGITASFYKFFWSLLKKPLLDCYRQAIIREELSCSQRRGLINMFHKGNNKTRDDLGNWRPITLTNVDHKIFTKVLAIRLQKVIKTIINENQSGFIKGRQISTHIRLIDDIIKYANTENLGGVVVSLDYQKAFDTVDKTTVICALKMFGFGHNFIKLIVTILKNTESAVTNGGWISGYFETNRGLRQGCCISPLLFVLVVEVLAIKLREQKNIRSIFDANE